MALTRNQFNYDYGKDKLVELDRELSEMGYTKFIQEKGFDESKYGKDVFNFYHRRFTITSHGFKDGYLMVSLDELMTWIYNNDINPNDYFDGGDYRVAMDNMADFFNNSKRAGGENKLMEFNVDYEPYFIYS